MSENSIEFQPMPGIDSGKDQTRNSYRVPASYREDVQAVFDQKTYPVVNLSNIGIAVRAESYQEFETGQIVENAELVLGDQRLYSLSGKVIHCSAHDSGDPQFGISWVNMASENKDRLNAFIAKLKKEALKGDPGPDDRMLMDNVE